MLFVGCRSDNVQIQKNIFEPEQISTQLTEYSATFSQSGKEIYFSRSLDQWGKGEIKSSIYFSVKENKKWSEPKLASFSGHYDDSAPYLTNQGKTLYFISKRPSKGAQQISMDIWKVEKANDGEWGTPVRLNDLINSEKNEYCIRDDKHGNLYFASDREGGFGQGDLYMAKKVNNRYQPPFNLGNILNSETGEWNLEVNAEGNILIFEASGKPQNLSPYGDLYISFKLNDRWSFPQNIKEINTSGSDLYPELIEGDDILYFSSSDSLKSTTTNIYSVAFNHIHMKYKKTAVFNSPEK